MTTTPDNPSPPPPQKPAATPAAMRTALRSTIPALAGIALCALLAVAQVAIAGYQMGVGNQSIQIAFLKRWADPSLFPVDAMITQTMPLYPSFFFMALAPLLKIMDVSTLYLALQILTSFLALAAVYWLSRGIYRTHTAALAAVALLVAGHLHALAGDTLYSEGFTHTFVALPVAVLALALAYRGRWLWAFAVAGVLFNIHALTSAYAIIMLSAALLADLREMPLPQSFRRIALCGVIAGLLAVPTLILMLKTHQSFDGAWINLMRIRSADHSFPSTWWVSGDPDIPRFALLTALFVLSWSFTPVRRAQIETPRGQEDPDAPAGDPAAAFHSVRRAAHMSILMTLSVLALFAAGYLFTEVWPVPVMIRLQPFRASRLLMVLMLVHIAHGAIAAIRAGVHGRALGTDGQRIRVPGPARVAEFIAGVAILLTLGVPAFLPLLPFTLIIALLTAAVAGHLSWKQALVAIAALFVAVLAYLQIDFPLPLLAERFSIISTATPASAAARSMGWTAITLALLFTIAIAATRRRVRAAVIALSAVAGLTMAGILFVQDRADLATTHNATSDLAAWARKTAPNSLFLAPTGFANFRVNAERSLVVDWRDGTQLYFCAAYGPDWFKSVKEIEPGIVLTDDGRRLVTRGDDELDSLTDQQFLALARKYQPKDGQFYIILPTPAADHPRGLVAAYTDSHFTAYLPTLRPEAQRPVPPGVENAIIWNDVERFMDTKVRSNIEKYRKADVTIQVVDDSGRTVQGRVKLDETKSAFDFGTSLGFFEPESAQIRAADQDLLPPPVRPIELEKMPEVFNASMIPFSGKWAYIEPERGLYRWSDLDKYVDYCVKNDIDMEFHHLTGIRPLWVRDMGGPGGMTGLIFPAIDKVMQDEFNRHCLAVVDRYQDKIKYYQVVNEKYMMEYVPAAWKILKAKYPNIQFGLSDCINFYDDPNGRGRGGFGGPGGGETLETKGLDAVKWLTSQGIKPDFFSMHGHHPANLWADPREMYAQIDRVAALSPGMRIHLSEEYLQLGGRITGPIRSGQLTPELQAEYLVRYFTIGFSHPAVDMVNLWGGMGYYGWTNTGILDSNGKPTPSFDALKKLFTETFRSHTTGELDIDGTYAARVFHGTYQITLTLDDGKEITVKAIVPQQTEAKIRLKFDHENGTLEVEH